MKEKLMVKRCPFCNKVPKVEHVWKTDKGAIEPRDREPKLKLLISCVNKLCIIKPSTRAFRFALDAIGAWQTRF